MLSLEMTTDSLTSSSSRYSMEIDLCLSSVAIAMLSGLGVGAEGENEDLHKNVVTNLTLYMQCTGMQFIQAHARGKGHSV